MTLQQLRYVTTVAETGTISGAAKALFISQPSLTAAIQELEREMGITIFLRTNRGVVLSREGDEFLGYARQVLMQAELLEDRYGAQSSHRQQFAVSAQHYNFAARVFARVVRDMGGERYSMTFRETTTYEVIEDVGRMRSEVGVLVMTEQNGEVLRRLFREYELTYTELVQKDATVYVDKTAKAEEQKVDKVIGELYEYYLAHVDQMSNFYVQLAYQDDPERAVTDYISGMSDEFAIRTFEDVFVPRKWHVL